MCRPYSKCSVLHEANPVTFIKFLETKLTKKKTNKTIPITPNLISHLQWWLNPTNISKGRSFLLEETGLTIITDASMTCMGTLEQLDSQGNWDKTKRMLHIRCLEMEAVFLTLKHFKYQDQNKTVLIRCNNTTVVQYIN